VKGGGRGRAKKKTDLVFARIRDTATSHMERLFSDWFLAEGTSTGRKFTYIPDLYGADPDEHLRFHFVFCLDESGSMADQWSTLVQAYRNFLEIRCKSQRGNNDIASVVQFSSAAAIAFQGLALNSCPINLKYHDGGTNFDPALLAAKPLLTAYGGYRPVLVFMTDGQNGDGNAPVTTIRAMKAAVPSLDCVGIAFGTQSPGLDAMMNAVGGKLKQASSGQDLISSFEEIARGSSATEKLAQSMAERISKELVDKIVLDFL